MKAKQMLIKGYYFKCGSKKISYSSKSGKGRGGSGKLKIKGRYEESALEWGRLQEMSCLDKYDIK